MSNVQLPESVAYIQFVNDTDEVLVSAEMARHTEPRQFAVTDAAGEIIESGSMDLEDAVAAMIGYLTGKQIEVTVREIG